MPELNRPAQISLTRHPTHWLARVGIAAGSSNRFRHFGQGVELKVILEVLEELLFSPLLDFVLALVLFRLGERVVQDTNLFSEPKDRPPTA